MHGYYLGVLMIDKGCGHQNYGCMVFTTGGRTIFPKSYMQDIYANELETPPMLLSSGIMRLMFQVVATIN